MKFMELIYKFFINSIVPKKFKFEPVYDNQINFLFFHTLKTVAKKQKTIRKEYEKNF